MGNPDTIRNLGVPRIKSVSARGFEWLIDLEGGLKLKAYWDKDGQVWTIGGGLTFIHAQGGLRRVNGNDVFESEFMAREAQRKRIKHYEVSVDAAFRDDITQQEFDAFTSLCWNCEIAVNPQFSSLPRLFNARAPKEKVVAKLMEYVHSGKKIVPGLVKRRECEADLILHGVYHLQGESVKSTAADTPHNRK